jgi:hypothetical protein
MYAAREILTSILHRDTAARSATETIRTTLSQSASLATLAPRFQHALETAVRPAYKKIFRDRYGDRVGDIAQTPGYAQLRRALLAGEQAGHHPARLLARAAGTRNPDAFTDEQLVERLTSRITSYLNNSRTPAPAGPVPAWLAIPPCAGHAISQDIPPYLNELHNAIAARTAVLTELAIATQPAWIQAIGVAPHHTAARAQWNNCLAIIAAWRDQHSIAEDSPHILGPRPEPASSDEPAWRHATTAITKARRLASTPAASREHGPRDRPRSPYTSGPERAMTTRRDLPLLQPSPHQHERPRQITW